MQTFFNYKSSWVYFTCRVYWPKKDCETLESLLAHSLKDEDKTNVECSQCNDIKRDAKLLHRIHKYPRILVIQLKRFKAVLKVDESRRAKKNGL